MTDTPAAPNNKGPSGNPGSPASQPQQQPQAQPKPSAPASVPASAPADVKQPVNPLAKDHWKRGNSLFEESKFNDAIQEYVEALKIDSQYADAYFNRALTYRILNNFDAARKDLEVVIQLQPKSADAPLLIGDMAEGNNDLLGARY